MKRLFFLLSFFFCFTATSAFADVVPCLAAGEVNLKISRQIDMVSGYIGTTRIYLSVYQNLLYGEVEGMETNLRINGRHVKGTIGQNNIYWTYKTGDVIEGYQRCLYNFSPTANN